jgi:hypothetical protein
MEIFRRQMADVFDERHRLVTPGVIEISGLVKADVDSGDFVASCDQHGRKQGAEISFCSCNQYFHVLGGVLCVLNFVQAT